MGFNSELDRFLVKDMRVPPPGYYKNVEVGLKMIKKPVSHNKNITAFGTYERRFVVKDMKVPGPGEYRPEQSHQALQNKRHEIQSKSPMFLAPHGRVISDPVLEHSPPVGCYDPVDTHRSRSDMQPSPNSPRKVS